ncbi:MAG: bifunctional hydroxymethylpyrimidine kinase/phosphomethylpyrimidine kinase, partial [Clostridia bacterium]|nr:bifunctional hydroxymethylpyrimidine kinase/phosphomethylpyrimidine kinase [Clostridia bacterium]
MRVLVINDISCIGKCSLSVALPIVSACGVTCDVLPTAILSTHTGGFTGYTFRDLTDDLPDILKHWKTLGVSFDYILSGYLGSVKQIELVEYISREFLKPNGKFIVDPVMGDSGKLYAGFTNEFVEKMKELCKLADFILPNLTEGCLLSGVPYPKNGEIANGDEIVKKLASINTCPILTGVEEGNLISVYARIDGKTQTFEMRNVEGFFCGAGDVFASAFVGALARDKS